MNVTSRIEGETHPDEILISADTRNALPRDAFSFGEARHLSVKGIEDAIVVYPVLGMGTSYA